MLNVTLGTAGHVDHGKTLLVQSLTGCNTDRLKEEKERGMSIDLGYAPCRISDLEVGIVDVPGHESFIKTMVAGACGMDGVILVVAADDGIMPQTREHLDILTLLGLRHGLVALTKIDRVDEARRQEVIADLCGFLQGTFLEGCADPAVLQHHLRRIRSLSRGPGRSRAIDHAPAGRRRLPHAAGSGLFRQGLRHDRGGHPGRRGRIAGRRNGPAAAELHQPHQTHRGLRAAQRDACSAANVRPSTWATATPRRSAAATCSRCPAISRRRNSTSAACGSCRWKRCP